jgi:hypothetical protein
MQMSLLRWRRALAKEFLEKIKKRFPSLKKGKKGEKLSTYNPYSSSLYRISTSHEENIFNPILGNKKRHDRNYQALSFLANSDFVFDTLEISKNIPDDEIKDALYNIIYEELDNSVKYDIMFDEIKHSEEEKREYREFNIFIVDPNIVRYMLNSIGRTIKYIDYLYPVPLLFKSLYQFSGITDRIECFVYTYRDGTSFNLFMNNQLIYSKLLGFSTIILYENFCKELDEKLPYLDFQKRVTNEETFFQNRNNRVALTKSLHSFFDEVFDVVNYIKRSFNIEIIDNLYYSSTIGRILGISEYSKALIGEHSFDGFLKEFGIKFPEDIDEVHYLLYLTYQLNRDKSIYLDILKPPPSLLSRPSGKLILVTASSIAISMLYPTYNYYQVFLIDENIKEKRVIEKSLKKRYLAQKSVLDNIYKERNSLQKERDNYKDKYDKKFELISEIYNKRVNYTMKGVEIGNITSKLNTHSVSIASLGYVEDENGSFFEIELVSDSDKQVTELLKSLVSEYEIFTNSIELDPNSDIYRSSLRVWSR